MAVNVTAGTAGFISPGTATIAGKFTDLRIYGRDKSPIIMADARKYPLVPAIMEVGGQIDVDSNKFDIWQDEDEKLRFTPSQASDGASEEQWYFSAADSRHLRPGHILIIDGIWWNGTTAYTTEATAKAAGVTYHAERARVISIGAESATTQVIVARESTTNVATTYTILKIGSAMPDGWSAGNPFSVELDSVYNVIQNFSEVVGVDENRQNERTWGPEDMDRDTVRKRNSFNRQLAMGFHFGVRDATGLGADGRQRRQMGGMMEFTPVGNVQVLGGVLTIAQMNTYSEAWFDQGSDTKYAFVGPTLATYIANKQISQLVQNDELAARIGVPKVMSLELTHGTLQLITDYSLQGLSLAAGMMIYDLEYLKRAYLQNMNVRVLENVQDNDEHQRKDEITGSMSLWRVFAESHHRLENVTG